MEDSQPSVIDQIIDLLGRLTVLKDKSNYALDDVRCKYQEQESTLGKCFTKDRDHSNDHIGQPSQVKESSIKHQGKERIDHEDLTIDKYHHAIDNVEMSAKISKIEDEDKHIGLCMIDSRDIDDGMFTPERLDKLRNKYGSYLYHRDPEIKEILNDLKAEAKHTVQQYSDLHYGGRTSLRYLRDDASKHAIDPHQPSDATTDKETKPSSSSIVDDASDVKQAIEWLDIDAVVQARAVFLCIKNGKQPSIALMLKAMKDELKQKSIKDDLIDEALNHLEQEANYYDKLICDLDLVQQSKDKLKDSIIDVLTDHRSRSLQAADKIRDMVHRRKSQWRKYYLNRKAITMKTNP